MDSKIFIRIYKIIHLYFQMPDPSEALRMQFVEWLSDESNSEEKDAVLELIFNRIMEGGSIQDEFPEELMEANDSYNYNR